ncbi:MAG TPA: hypothetical protein VHW64_16140 [Nocardioides sp.]|jgi:hypothetical protein|uniref:hypothetical protein n=1 Tax=Nocardioides sp. TaxID=35761 RepID=UPI002E2F987E|nr:hypothetical protein [Nocardioides sp.]HEX3932232.1 hypothetical protein [Nocardioides sp.]
MSTRQRASRRLRPSRVALAVAAAAAPLAVLLTTAAGAASAATYEQDGDWGKVEFGAGWTSHELVTATEGSDSGKPVSLMASAEVKVGTADSTYGLYSLPLDHTQLVTLTVELQDQVDDPRDLSRLPQWQAVSDRTFHGRFAIGAFQASTTFPRTYFPIGPVTADSPPYRIVYDVSWVDELTGRTDSHEHFTPQGLADERCDTPNFTCWTVPADGSVVVRPRL